MRNSTLAAAAIAAGLGLAAPAANAMPVAPPGQLGAAEGAAGALKKTVLVCDPWTCYWRPDYGGYPRSLSGMAPPLLVGLASSMVGVAASVGLVACPSVRLP